MFIVEFLLGMSWRTWLYAGIAALVLGGVAYYTTKVYNQGYNASQKAINDANAKSLDTANKAQQDVDACFASGRTWDRASGQCL